MPRFARLAAVEVRDSRPGLQRMTLADGSEAYALTDLCGPVTPGDELLVNTTALDLGLGTGGAHVVHTNLSSPFGGDAGPGRVMKARYLAEQLPADAFEEAAAAPSADLDEDSFVLPSLRGVRVAFCVLHSHAMALAAAVQASDGDAPGYVMTDGGALPFVLSDLAASCLEGGSIATAVSTGQAFGAPIEAVTVASGVAALAGRGIRRVVVSPGLGHVGTASALGFSALDLAGHAAVLDGLGAATSLAVRASSTDQRERHRGVSHHARALAALAPRRTVVPVPASGAGGDAAWAATLGDRAAEFKPISVAQALTEHRLRITSMGRPLADDSCACAWLGAAAAWLAVTP